MGFLVIDIVSMITFTLYTACLESQPFVAIGLSMCAIGWVLTIWFCRYFQWCDCDAKDDQARRDTMNAALRNASKISVLMDVGGKCLTYAAIIFGSADEKDMPVAIVALE